MIFIMNFKNLIKNHFFTVISLANIRIFEINLNFVDSIFNLHFKNYFWVNFMTTTIKNIISNFTKIIYLVKNHFFKKI